MRPFFTLFVSMGLAVLQVYDTTLFAHEGHISHAGIPLWQIASVSVLVLIAYFGLTVWRRRQINQRNNKLKENEKQNKNDRLN